MDATVRIYDLVLVAAMIGAAWKALLARDAFVATAFFIANGLLMALAWVQLGAIDVALAEACIGAGLTGALLIGAIRQFEKQGPPLARARALWRNAAIALLLAPLLSGLLASVVLLSDPISSIPPLVQARLSQSGTSHPVTAVLLNFRAFDTWLELGVLLLACIAAIGLHRIYDNTSIPARVQSQMQQPRLIARTMLPLLILIGGVVLWFGSWAPGGAFQAGAIAGAAGILLQISGERGFLRFYAPWFRLTLALGFALFVALGAYTIGIGNNLLQYQIPWAGMNILLLEAGAAASVALTLNVMYAASHPWKARRI